MSPQRAGASRIRLPAGWWLTRQEGDRVCDRRRSARSHEFALPASVPNLMSLVPSWRGSSSSNRRAQHVASNRAKQASHLTLGGAFGMRARRSRRDSLGRLGEQRSRSWPAADDRPPTYRDLLDLFVDNAPAAMWRPAACDDIPLWFARSLTGSLGRDDAGIGPRCGGGD